MSHIRRYANFGNFPAGNYTAFEDDGTLVLNGNATVYDDIQVSVATAKVPAVNAPTWTTFAFGIGGGIAFQVLGFALNDYFEFTVQTSHRQKLSTILDDHFHWTIPTNDAGKKIKFRLDVIYANPNEAFAVPTGSPFTAEYTLTATESGYHKIFDLADIPGVNTVVSTLYLCKFTRVAASSADYGSPVYVLAKDSHFQLDTMGSRGEYSK